MSVTTDQELKPIYHRCTEPFRAMINRQLREFEPGDVIASYEIEALAPSFPEDQPWETTTTRPTPCVVCQRPTFRAEVCGSACAQRLEHAQRMGRKLEADLARDRAYEPAMPKPAPAPGSVPCGDCGGRWFWLDVAAGNAWRCAECVAPPACTPGLSWSLAPRPRTE